MTSPYDVGHAMRRRHGIPSNYLEATGAPMGRTIPTSDEHYAAAANAGSARVTYGAAQEALMSQFDEFSPEQFQGHLTPRKSTQAGDPTGDATQAHRQGVQERIGAQYRVNASYSASVDPAAAETMHNARVVPSVHGRNFSDVTMAVQSSQV
jgi:hypothetical protein